MDGCPTCGLFFCPNIESEVEKHEKYHENFIKASGIFGLIYNYDECEEIKKVTAYILQDPSSSFEQKLSAIEEDLRTYFSRSLRAANFSTNHVSFDVYVSMLLNSEKHYRKHYGNDIYDALVKKFGKRKGIEDEKTHFLIKDNL